jgi:hypothetical protein
MTSILGLIYPLFFLSYVLVAMFIVFHILRYSLKRSAALFGVTLFLTVFLVLLVTNILIFVSLPLGTLLPAIAK